MIGHFGMIIKARNVTATPISFSNIDESIAGHILSYVAFSNIQTELNEIRKLLADNQIILIVSTSMNLDTEVIELWSIQQFCSF